MIDRQQIIAALHGSLEAIPEVAAAWIGGSAAFGRADEFSDIDIQCLAESEHAGDIFGRVEEALGELSPISEKLVIPDPTWHGNPQRLYRLEGTSRFAVVDFVIMSRDLLPKFTTLERSGESLILFDRDGDLAPAPLDRAELDERIAAEIRDLKAGVEIYTTLARKEIERGHPVDAMAFYWARTLRPLITVLRIMHCPERFDFGPRYLMHDLPRPEYERIEALSLVGSMADLRAKQGEAERWLRDLLRGLESQPQ